MPILEKKAGPFWMPHTAKAMSTSAAIPHSISLSQLICESHPDIKLLPPRKGLLRDKCESLLECAFASGIGRLVFAPSSRDSFADPIRSDRLLLCRSVSRLLLLLRLLSTSISPLKLILYISPTSPFLRMYSHHYPDDSYSHWMQKNLIHRRMWNLPSLPQEHSKSVIHSHSGTICHQTVS